MAYAANGTASLSSTTMTESGSITVTFSQTATSSAYYNVQIADSSWSTTYVNTNIASGDTYTISGYSAGTYQIYIGYWESGSWKSDALSTTTFTVTEDDATSYELSLSVSDSTPTLGDSVTVTASFTVDGTATDSIPDDCTLSIWYQNDSDWVTPVNGSSSTTSTTISLSSSLFTEGSTYTVQASLYDSDWNTLASGSVTFTVNGNSSGGDTEDEDTYAVSITPSATTCEQNESITFTATVTYGGEEIDLSEQSDVYLWLWADSWADGHSSGLTDCSISPNTGLANTVTITFPSEGTYYIAYTLEDSSYSTLLTSTEVATITVTESTADASEEITTGSLSCDFMRGMDLSTFYTNWTNGAVYYDYDGNEYSQSKDNAVEFFEFLYDCGVDWVRLRVWNDPYDSDGNPYGGGNNNVEVAKTIGAWASEAGMTLLIDFHYSDFWADPGRQLAPKAWSSYTNIDDKAEALYDYTYDSLEELLDAGLNIGMVQVGNETNGSFCGESISTWSNYDTNEDWQNIVTLFKSGSAAVRQISEDYDTTIKVALHFTNPNNSNPSWYAGLLDDAEVDYDAIGISYYMYWHGTLSNLQSEISTIYNNYGKEVFIAETAYPYTDENFDSLGNQITSFDDFDYNSNLYAISEDGQEAALTAILDAVSGAEGCIGLFYWEPAWTALDSSTLDNGTGWATKWAGDYISYSMSASEGTSFDNQTLFDNETGEALQSLSFFCDYVEGDLPEHTWDDGEVTTEATETEDGVITYTCTVCGETKTETYSYTADDTGDSGVNKSLDNWGLDAATTYPEYPEDGAVRINKTATNDEDFTFQETGVTKVELDVAGISVKTGIDVILIVDVSNSMAWSMDWADDMDDDEVSSAGDADKAASSVEETKLYMAMQSATQFANILLGDNTDGSETNNSLTFVTFAGYDKQNSNGTQTDSTSQTEYIDSVQTAFLNVQDAESASTAFTNTQILYDSSAGKYTLTIGDKEGNTTSGLNRGNTNYDYAFWQASQAITSLKSEYYTTYGTSYDESDREIYVVFMTDGAASHYNGQRAQGSANDYLPGTATVYPSVGYYATSQGLTNNTTNWLSYMNSNDNTYANALYALATGGFYAVGFDLANGGFGSFSFTEEELTEVLEGMVTDATIPVSAANSATDLNSFYTSLANTLKYAGSYAEVTDVINSNFTLLLGSDITTVDGESTVGTNQIQVIAYDLYTSSDDVDDSLIGTRTGTYSVIETVSFSGGGTAAYSDLIDDGETNIMTTDSDGNVTISAYYFTYTNIDGVETFSWSIGNITDKEIALSFYVYLKNAAGEDDEGADAGTYYTNESATLEYVDINGCYATQTFPVPAVTWGSAGTTVEYYLVNSSGQPVNYNGDVIPFANRIIVGTTYTVTFNYNVETTVYGSAYTETCGVSSYEMYSSDAYYTVEASSDGTGSLTIHDNLTVNSTEGSYSTILVSSSADGSYVASQVAFGVILPESVKMITPVVDDTIIVVDYGKSIDISLSSAMEALQKDGITVSIYDSAGTNLQSTADYTSVSVELVGLTTYHGTNVGQSYSSYVTSYTGTYGQFTYTSGSSVTYQLTTMNFSGVEAVYAVFKITDSSNDENYFYACGSIYVVPATSVYYEDGFVDTYTDGSGSITWSEVTDTTDQATTQTQDAGVVTKYAPYAYDSSYDDDTAYSNGSAHKVTVPEGTATSSYPTATFTFTGTGFDLFSNTGEQQGLIKVQVYSGETVVKTVSVQNTGDNDLYQIPVISIEGLDYGAYTVVITVAKAYQTSDTTLSALNRGGEFQLDAIRIYDPVQTSVTTGSETYETVNDVYLADQEANAVILEVRDAIVSAQDYDSTSDSGTEESGAVYIHTESTTSSATTSDSTATVVDYTLVGPNNEVYLLGNSSAVVGFKLWVSEIPQTVQIGAKSPLGDSVTLNMQLVNHTDSSKAVTVNQTLSQATVQNYSTSGSLSDVFVSDTTNGGYYTYVYISNAKTDSSTILSIMDVKATFANAATMSFLYSSDVVDAYTEASDTTSAPTISSAAISGRARYARTTTIQVTTTAELGDDYTFAVTLGSTTYTVGGSDGLLSSTKLTVSDPVDNGDGTYTYTLSLKPYKVGSQTFTVYILNSSGESVDSESFTARIYII
ncbi:MAG: arabinogalactan endo-1,4-beta-galactosidase [Clostridiales bacterium]|nr:arabinogalactan endo-1,4-beta-galactosidase [Clostridiales bacterium]